MFDRSDLLPVADDIRSKDLSFEQLQNLLLGALDSLCEKLRRMQSHPAGAYAVCRELLAGDGAMGPSNHPLWYVRPRGIDA